MTSPDTLAGFCLRWSEEIGVNTKLSTENEEHLQMTTTSIVLCMSVDDALPLSPVLL